MRVLLTGGSGNVGTVAARRLKRHHQVTVFDLNPPRVGGLDYIEGDLLDLAQVTAATAGVEALVNLAAIPVPLPGEDERVFNTNVVGLHNVLLAAQQHGINRVIHASSDSVLGYVMSQGEVAPEYLPLDEEHPLQPDDAYSLSKVVNEETCKAFSRRGEMTTICLRYCWVWWWPDSYRQQPELARDPARYMRPLWGYIDARDVAAAIDCALTAPVEGFEAFFLSAPDTFCEVPTLELIARYLPEARCVRNPAQFRRRPHRGLWDLTKAERLLAWRPRYRWRQELKRLQESALES